MWPAFRLALANSADSVGKTCCRLDRAALGSGSSEESGSVFRCLELIRKFFPELNRESGYPQRDLQCQGAIKPTERVCHGLPSSSLSVEPEPMPQGRPEQILVEEVLLGTNEQARPCTLQPG